MLPSGALSRSAAQEVPAAASERKGDPDLWLAALKQTGWVDDARASARLCRTMPVKVVHPTSGKQEEADGSKPQRTPG